MILDMATSEGSQRVHIDTTRFWNFVAFPLFLVVGAFGLYAMFSAPKVQRVAWGSARGFGNIGAALPGLRLRS